MKLWCKS